MSRVWWGRAGATRHWANVCINYSWASVVDGGPMKLFTSRPFITYRWRRSGKPHIISEVTMRSDVCHRVFSRTNFIFSRQTPDGTSAQLSMGSTVLRYSPTPYRKHCHMLSRSPFLTDVAHTKPQNSLTFNVILRHLGWVFKQYDCE